MSSQTETVLHDKRFASWLVQRLLQKPDFRVYFADRIVGKSQIFEEKTEQSDLQQNQDEKLQIPAVPNRENRMQSKEISELKRTLQQLLTNMQLLRDNFQNFDHYAISPSPSRLPVTPASNRSAVHLFSVQKWLHNLVKTQNPELLAQLAHNRKIEELSRISTVCRGLCTLVKRLALSISQMDVSILPTLASNISSSIDMLRLFAAYITRLPTVIRDSLNSAPQQMLAQIVILEKQVLQPLQELSIRWKQFHERYVAAAVTTPTRPKSVPQPKIRYLKPDFKPKGFLMPLPLKERRLRHVRKLQNNYGVIPRRPCQAVGKIDNMMKTIDAIESKWTDRHVLPAQSVHRNTRDAQMQVTLDKVETKRNTFEGEIGVRRSANNLASKVLTSAVDRLCSDLDQACDLIVDNICEQEFAIH